MNEAKYSANVKANLRGYDVQITARSDGEDDLLTVLVAMVEELDRIGAQPERRWENGPSAGRGNGNGKPGGNGHAEAKAEPKAETKPQPQPAPAPKPAPKAEPKPTPKQAPRVPACHQCGSDVAVELIKWVDRSTGEQKQAYKCQSCNVWIRD